MITIWLSNNKREVIVDEDEVVTITGKDRTVSEIEGRVLDFVDRMDVDHHILQAYVAGSEIMFDRPSPRNGIIHGVDGHEHIEFDDRSQVTMYLRGRNA